MHHKFASKNNQIRKERRASVGRARRSVGEASNMEQVRKLSERRKAVSNDIERALDNMDKIAAESKRVGELAHHARSTLDALDMEFERQTKLDKLDVSFLFFATALQCIRQYWLSNDKFRFEKDSEPSNMLKRKLKKDYSEILLGPVPYDAFKKTASFQILDINTGLSGVNHRYTTLGHDPLLGWIFGTINIATDSLTKNNLALESYRVINSTHIDAPVPFPALVTECSELFSDYKFAACCVVRQATHFATDAFTKMGLPIPVLNQISPDITSTLMKSGIDVYGVTRSIAAATLINTVIAVVHGLFYDHNRYGNRDVYEVKTRKILCYSNAIASTSNIILGAIRLAGGDVSSLKTLDIGGLIVTVYRLTTDAAFIQKVKEDFIFGGFDRLIQGDEYDFET